MKLRAAASMSAAVAVLVALSIASPASQASVRGGQPPATGPRALVFFNSLCQTCKADATRIKTWSVHEQRRYTIIGVGFMMSTRDSIDFAKHLGWKFPVQGDPAGRLEMRYHIWSPTAILLIDGRNIRHVNYARW